MTPTWPEWGRSATRYTVGTLITAAIVVLLAMPSEPAAWAVVALVVVLGATMGQSVTAAVNRMAGSVVGCLTGAVVQLGLPWLWLPIRVAIAVLACMLICRLLRITAGQRLGMALAGFFVFVPGDEEWQTVGWRLLATLIGILVALAITLVLWPARARDRLLSGIDVVLSGIADSLERDRRRLRGEDAGAEPAIASVAALRPLVAERRYEPPGRGPGPAALSGVLDGLDLAIAGAQRLAAVSAPGPQGLARTLAPDLDPLIAALVARCDQLRDQLGMSRAARPEPAAVAARSGVGSGDSAAVDDALSAALERLRSMHLTFAADAEELRDLFRLLESISLTASGLSRAGAALEG